MLQTSGLTLTHTKDSRVLIRDLSFTVNDRQKTVIIGEEGNGKSTLLRLLHDPSLVEDYIEVTGTIRKNGSRARASHSRGSQSNRATTMYTVPCTPRRSRRSRRTS